MRKILLLMLGFILFANITFAQKTTVKGRITDTNGVGVPSATVKEKGTKNAVSADGEGNFTISVSPNAILQFTATGFGMVELAADKTSSVRMKEEVDNLSEVVVTALGVKREKKALGYAVQEVKGENLTIAKSLDISTSLAGKVAGVQLVGSPSSSFDNADILIRGVTGLGP